MRNEVIHQKYSLQVPDQYETLSEADLRQMYRSGDPFRWGVRDRENHVIIIAMWKQYPALLSWALDLKAIAKKNEQLTRNLHGDRGYRLLEFFSMQAGGEPVEGYRFCARNESDVSQVSSCFLLKDGKTVYSFICTCREEQMDEALPVINQMMASLRKV